MFAFGQVKKWRRFARILLPVLMFVQSICLCAWSCSHREAHADDVVFSGSARMGHAHQGHQVCSPTPAVRIERRETQPERVAALENKIVAPEQSRPAAEGAVAVTRSPLPCVEKLYLRWGNLRC